jgi:hypothetical protein
MTTYSYQVTLDDSECIAVKEALERYRDFCESRLADGAPYWAHLRSIDDVLGRLLANAQMTSTSSFSQPKDDPNRKG